MNTRIVSILAFASVSALAACKKSEATTTTTSASSAPAASAAPAASSAPAPKTDECDKNDKPFTPDFATVDFDWSEKPSLASAPKDGVYLQIGDGKPMKADEVEIWVDKKRSEWSIRARTSGPGLGPSLSFKDAPKAGLSLDEKLGSNRGYFQIPKKGSLADCFKQTTSYNGSNARVVKITAYDENAKKASGSFVTTWKESFGDKRTFWAAGTFKDARVVVFK